MSTNADQHSKISSTFSTVHCFGAFSFGCTCFFWSDCSDHSRDYSVCWMSPIKFHERAMEGKFLAFLFFFKKKKTSWLRDYWVWLRINCIANVWLVCALSPQFGLFSSILVANSHLSHINYQQKSVTHSKEHAVYSVPHATYTCDCLVCLWSTGKREHAVPLTQTAWPVCSLDFRPLISVRIWIHDLPWSPSSTQKRLTKPCMQWEPSAISTLCPGFTNSLHSL